VSTETPAAHLARLKVQFPGWAINRNAPAVPGNGFTATERKNPRRRITVTTLAELEAILLEQDGR
jgi:hypothetical protein